MTLRNVWPWLVFAAALFAAGLYDSYHDGLSNAPPYERPPRIIQESQP